MRTASEKTEEAAAGPAGWRLSALLFWQETRREIAGDRAIYALAGFYVAAAVILALAVPGHQSVNLLLYAPLWLHGGVAALLLFLLARSLPGVIRDHPKRPLAALVERMAGFVTPRAVAGIVLIGIQALLMGTFTSVKNMLPDVAVYGWDGLLADIDAAIHGGADPWTFLTAIVSRQPILRAVEFVYVSGWMVMVGLVLPIVALSPALAAIRVRFFLTYILAWMVVGNLLAGLFMSAGPAFFGEVAGDHARFAPLLDFLAGNSGSAWSARDIQLSLWQLYEHGMVSFGSGISAFPSMHVSMATLWAITAFQRSRTLGFAALAFLGVILASSVALGWHYAADGYASIVLTLLIWHAVGRLPIAGIRPKPELAAA
jgi:hypothetical protein